MTTENGIVAENLPCLTCGYNLRTLAHHARCPECGADVSNSLAAGNFPGIHELRRIARGTAIISLLGMGLILLLPTLYFLSDWLRDGVGILFLAYLALYGAGLAASAWYITTPHVNTTLRDTVLKIRIASIIFMICWLFPLITQLTGGLDWVSEHIIITAPWFALQISAAVLSFALGSFFEDRCIASRSRHLAGFSNASAKILGISLIICHLCLAAVILLQLPETGFCFLVPLLPALPIAAITFIHATITQVMITVRFSRLAQERSANH